MKISEKEFLKKVDVAKGCWTWKGAISASGYGTMMLLGKTTLAHRISYELFKGKIPAGMVIDHKCKNKVCVNPQHLRVVTHKQNTLENSNSLPAVNAQKTHCEHGHPLKGENLIIRIRDDGRKMRACRICSRGWWRESKRRFAAILKGKTP